MKSRSVLAGLADFVSSSTSPLTNTSRNFTLKEFGVNFLLWWGQGGQPPSNSFKSPGDGGQFTWAMPALEGELYGICPTEAPPHPLPSSGSNPRFPSMSRPGVGNPRWRSRYLSLKEDSSSLHNSQRGLFSLGAVLLHARFSQGQFSSLAPLPEVEARPRTQSFPGKQIRSLLAGFFLPRKQRCLWNLCPPVLPGKSVAFWSRALAGSPGRPL